MAGFGAHPGVHRGHLDQPHPRRKRKLLLHKQQIIKISQKTAQGGYTLVPLQIYFSDGRAKVEIAVAKGKREYDKRQALRERQDRREAERAMSSRAHLGSSARLTRRRETPERRATSSRASRRSCQSPAAGSASTVPLCG
ncbi:hypothetical protein GCM10025881_05980 [Pseudolysinimonas kribbensis]|uniref:SsrA-binding protein n=1 Tax=Pseudolysinimonas kribbensis TaxID=433641 RepID=A0ABQ6K2V8_9MICO|nr:hypothetical protein GCM10025881_05980 [Pseudolysinimonas kribbensis]